MTTTAYAREQAAQLGRIARLEREVRGLKEDAMKHEDTSHIEIHIHCALCEQRCKLDPCPPRCHFRANMSREHVHAHCESDHPEYPMVRKNHPFVVQFRVRRGVAEDWGHQLMDEPDPEPPSAA